MRMMASGMKEDEFAALTSMSKADTLVRQHAGVHPVQRTRVSALPYRATRMLLPTLVVLSFACAALIAAGPESATDYEQQEKDLRAALGKAQTSQGENAEATL